MSSCDASHWANAYGTFAAGSYYVPFPATITGRVKRTASIVVAPLTCTPAESRSSTGTGKRHETRSAYLAAGGVGPPKTR